MRPSRTALSLGVLLLAVIVGDAAAVLHLRAEQRQVAAAAAARAAEQAYQVAVLDVAERLIPVRAPVADSYDLFLESGSDAAVRYDVFVRGALSADLSEMQDALTAVRPPADRLDLHGHLTGALNDMRAAVDRMAAPDRDQIGPDLEAFRAAALAWDRSLTREFGSAPPPVRTDGVASGTQTRAGVLFRWGTSCARALDELDALPDPVAEDREEAADVFDANAVQLQHALDELMAVEGPQAEQARLERDVLTSLRGLRPAVQALQEFASALRESDRGRLGDAIVTLDQLDVVFESASRGMEDYGSTTCSTLLDPGVLLAPDGADEDGDDTSAT